MFVDRMEKYLREKTNNQQPKHFTSFSGLFVHDRKVLNQFWTQNWIHRCFPKNIYGLNDHTLIETKDMYEERTKAGYAYLIKKTFESKLIPKNTSRNKNDKTQIHQYIQNTCNIQIHPKMYS